MALVTKSFSDIITFTRTGTSGTYFNSAGVLVNAGANVPRFDYNPSTLAAQGLLIEEARTNLLTYSADLSNAVWAFTGQLAFGSGSILNDGVAPDGTTTADKVVEDTSTGAHLISYGNVTTSTTATSSVSFFIKSAGRTTLSIRYGVQSTTNRMQANIDLNTGAVTGVSNIGTSTGATCTATPLTNQWWRITASVNPNDAASTQMRLLIYPNGVTGYTGDGTSGVYVWGAQLEAGAFPTSYIPTTTTALTRNADVASVNTLSPWYNALAGTIYAEYQTTHLTATQFAVSIDDSPSTSRATVAVTTTTFNGAVVDAGVAQATINQGTASTAIVKNAFAYAVNDFAFSANGAAPGTDTSGTVPSVVTQMSLGRRASGSGPLGGYLRRITYYPRRLSNAELQAITA